MADRGLPDRTADHNPNLNPSPSASIEAAGGNVAAGAEGTAGSEVAADAERAPDAENASDTGRTPAGDGAESDAAGAQSAPRLSRRLGLGWGRDVLAVLGFFTRLPVKAPAVPLAEAARAFPLAGALIGFVGFLAYMLGERLGLSDLLAAVFALVATALLTGALHEDGLADLADMLGVRGGRERKLTVMRDSTIGSYGVLALVFASLLKLGALAQLSLPGEVASALISAHVLGRAVLPVVMRSLPLARPDGIAVHAGKPAAESMYWSLGLAILIVGLVGGPGAAIVATVSALVTAFLIAKLAERQIGGYTGDVLGAIEQIVEVAVLINFATFR